MNLFCSIDGCEEYALPCGLCFRHIKKRPPTQREIEETYFYEGRLPWRKDKLDIGADGIEVNICCVPHCEDECINNACTVCPRHYARGRLRGYEPSTFHTKPNEEIIKHIDTKLPNIRKDARFTCNFPKCPKKHYAKGLCVNHYYRERRKVYKQQWEERRRMYPFPE